MIILVLWVLFAFYPDSVLTIKCHSCLTYCKTINGKVDAVNCDCKSPPSEQCSANACFAKVELFADESTAIVQLGNYYPTRLPSVECCHCTSRHGEDCDSGCSTKCRGNYCVVDFDGREQGCGLGYPRLPSFLRVDDYQDYEGDYLCTRYESSASNVMNGCVCTHPSGMCNEFNKTFNYQKKQVIERKSDKLHYCYALMHKAYKPFGQEVFKKSSTCEGHYCFISLTTSEIVLESADFKHNYEDHDEFIGAARPRFELQAGCVKVNGDNKIKVGCTVETQGNSSEVLAKHCICDSHLCNFHHLVRGTEDPRPKAPSVLGKQDPTQINPVRLFTSTKEVDENDILSVMNGAMGAVWSLGVALLTIFLL
uniref:Uncharacterized protein n=1 Tax=Caenorhabditis japonica TaxID=281687 RepID=A0A8R1HI35_CAEJA